jgi:hypothetical protein
VTDRGQVDRCSIPGDFLNISLRHQYILNGSMAFSVFYVPWFILSGFVMPLDSSVDIATGSGLDYRGLEGPISGRNNRFYSSLQRPDLL